MKVYGMLERAQLECLSSDPSGNIVGQLWLNTTSNEMKVYNNGQVRVLVDTDSSQSIANKTITGSIITGNTAANLKPDGTEVLTLPIATDTLVGKNTTDTLTNKTLTGNTAANLKPDGSATLTLPAATDTVVARQTSDTLENKVLRNSVVDQTLLLDHQGSDPADDSIAANKIALYQKNKTLYLKDENNAVVPVGSGSGGGLDTFYTEEMTALQADFTDQAVGNTGKSRGDHATFGTATAWSTAGTRLAMLSASSSGASPTTIGKDRSLKYETIGGSENEWFASDDIDIENKQRGKTVSASFYYLWDGADDKVEFVVYDRTNSKVLTSSSDVLKKATSVKKFVTTVTIPADCQKIKWGFHHKGTEASKTLKIDDIEISQDPFVQADLGTITEWENITINPTSYFPGLNGGTTGGSGSPPSDMNYRHRRVGDSLEVNISIDVGVSGGSNSNPGMDAGHANLAAFKLPNNLEVDFTKMISMKQVVGKFQFADDSSSNDLYGEGYHPNDTTTVTHTGGTGTHIALSPNAYRQEYVISAIDGWTELGTSGDTTYHSKNFLVLSERSATGGNTINLVDWEDIMGSSSSNRLLIQATIPIKGWGSTNTHIITPAKSNLTDWASYTPATTSTSGGTGHAHTGKWRRVGDSMEVVFELLLGTGAPHTNDAVVGLPTSVATSPWKNDYEIDISKLPHKNRIIGEFWIAQVQDEDLNIGSQSGSRSQVVMFNENYPGFVQLVQQSSSSNTELETNSQWNDIGPLGASDRIYGKFTVPIKGWGAEDHNFLAALPMTKWQRKHLAGNVTTEALLHNTTDNGDFIFQNLTEGTYRLSGQFKVRNDANAEGQDACHIEIKKGPSVNLFVVKTSNEGGEASTYSFNEMFTLTAADITAGRNSVQFETKDMRTGTDDILYLGDQNTFCILEKLPMHQNVSIF